MLANGRNSRRRFLAGGAGFLAVAASLEASADPTDAASLLKPVYSGSGGLPNWAPSTYYSVNQLVTVGGSTFACASAHTSGLTFPGVGTDWQALGPPQVASWVDQYGADPTGTHSSDAALAAAAAALGGWDGTGLIVLGSGTYRLADSYAITSSSLGLVGAGNDCTTIAYEPPTADTFLTVTDSSFTEQAETSPAGAPIGGFTIDGGGAPAGSQGLRYGDRVNADLDLVVVNFTGSGATGIRFDNQTGWSEQLRVSARVYNCDTAFLFDNHSGTPTYAYSDWDLFGVVAAGQDLLVIGGTESGAQIYRSRAFTLKGVCLTGNSNDGVAISFSNAGAELLDHIQVQLETNVGSGGPTTHQSIDMSAGGALAGYGELSFNPGTGPNFRPAELNPNSFGFVGKVDAPGDGNLGADTWPGAFTTVGAPIQYSIGYAGDGVIALTGGDTYIYALSNGVQAMALHGDTGRARRIRLGIQQPAVGDAGTVWPWPFKWPGGQPPTLSTDNNAIDWFDAWSDGSGNWYALLLGTGFA